jgi:hypothetical protein
MILSLLLGFTPRRFIGISGSITAQEASLSQNSFAIKQAPRNWGA